MNTRPGTYVIRILIFTAMLATIQGQAQETMLGVHGGSMQSSTPGSVSTIDQTNASIAIMHTPTPDIGITGVATNSEGRVFASTGTARFDENGPRLIEIDPATGQLLNDVGELLTPGGDDCYVGDLSFQPGTDILYGVLGTQGDNCGLDFHPGGVLVTIDTTTALVTVVGRDESIFNSNGGIAFAADGTLYFTPCWSNDSLLLTLNPASAEVLTRTNLESGTCYMGLAVRPSDGTLFGSYIWVDRDNDAFSLVTLDPSTGEATLVGDTAPEMIHDLTFTTGFPAFAINPGIADAWFNATTAGQGFFIVVFEDAGIVFLAWFTYDTELPPEDIALLGWSGHRWLTAQGPYEGAIATLDVFLTQGGIFDSAEPAPMTGDPIGTITITWTDCEHGILTYDIDPPGVMGAIPIRRIVPDNVALCEALQ